MLKNLTLFCVALMMMLLPLSVNAAPIDMHRAVSGADRPFTTLKDNIPTEWQLWLEPRITGPTTSDRDWHFPERGYNNEFNSTQSQILGLGHRRRLVEGDLTGIWLIWDMLVWVPVPHLLYLETVDAGGGFVDPWFNIEREQHLLGGFFFGGIREQVSVPNVDVVPEPTTGALILAGSLLLLSRGNRRRYARV